MSAAVSLIVGANLPVRAEVGAGNGLFFHALAKPNDVMISNDTDGSFYVVRDATLEKERHTLQRLDVVAGAPCKKLVTRRRTGRIVVELDGHFPYHVGDLLLSGPVGADKDGVWMSGVALSPLHFTQHWNSCVR